MFVVFNGLLVLALHSTWAFFLLYFFLFAFTLSVVFVLISWFLRVFNSRMRQKKMSNFTFQRKRNGEKRNVLFAKWFLLFFFAFLLSLFRFYLLLHQCAACVHHIRLRNLHDLLFSRCFIFFCKILPFSIWFCFENKQKSFAAILNLSQGEWTNEINLKFSKMARERKKNRRLPFAFFYSFVSIVDSIATIFCSAKIFFAFDKYETVDVICIHSLNKKENDLK